MTSPEKKTDELVDELLKGCSSPKEILGEQGLLKQLTRRLVERALEAELAEHLGYRSHAREGWGSGNSEAPAARAHPTRSVSYSNIAAPSR
jgi:putative transposase